MQKMIFGRLVCLWNKNSMCLPALLALALFAGGTRPLPAEAATLTVSGLAAASKVYDGSAATTVDFTSAVLNGIAPADAGNVTLDTSGYSASFSDKNVGDGKPVTVGGLVLAGSAAGTYTLTPPTLNANITARLLGIAATGANKTYNATTNATVTLSLLNKVSGDDVAAFYGTASFASKTVGAGKPVLVNDLFITGTDADNYDLTNTTATTTATISAKTLRVAATGQNKAYDGTTTATVTLSDNHVAGDIVTNSYASATFDDQYVGDGISIAVSGIAIGGADAGNYNLNSTTASAQANIEPRTLTITAAGVNKVYDGGTNATVSLGDNRLTNDVITVSFSSASFSGKNAGTNLTVTVAGLVITGPDSDSYSLTNTSVFTTANIASRSLNVVASGANKIYDGTTNAMVTLGDNRLSGDSLTDNYAGAGFTDKNVGSGKTVTVTGISVGGTDAGNYSLAGTTATTPANITARSLNVNATGMDKVYDGTTNATVVLGDNRIAGDSLTDAYTSAAFSDKNVGNSKLVSVVGIQVSGGDSGNYTLSNTTIGTTANITGRTLTVAITGQNKIYDGTTNATVTLGDNRVAGDALTTSYSSAGFGDKAVGNSKTVTVLGILVGGMDSTNYTLGSTNATTQANITPRSLSITATGVDKTYDGTTNATVTLGDNRVAGDRLTDTYTSAGFGDKNVGTGKTVNVTGIQVTGGDSENYVLSNSTANTTASITGRTLTVAASGQDRIYDGGTAATVTLSDNHLASDTITSSYASANFADKRTGNGKAINISGISIGGASVGNYTLAGTSATATANITARSLPPLASTRFMTAP